MMVLIYRDDYASFVGVMPGRGLWTKSIHLRCLFFIFHNPPEARLLRII
jgi:hypothetical protein